MSYRSWPRGLGHPPMSLSSSWNSGPRLLKCLRASRPERRESLRLSPLSVAQTFAFASDWIRRRVGRDASPAALTPHASPARLPPKRRPAQRHPTAARAGHAHAGRCGRQAGSHVTRCLDGPSGRRGRGTAALALSGGSFDCQRTAAQARPPSPSELRQVACLHAPRDRGGAIPGTARKTTIDYARFSRDR